MSREQGRKTGTVIAGILVSLCVLFMLSGKHVSAAETGAVHTISTKSEMVSLFSQMTKENDFTGVTVKLANDIYLAQDGDGSYDWQSAEYFNGIFDGQGHTVYYLRSFGSGLFWELGENGVVKNVILDII